MAMRKNMIKLQFLISVLSFFCLYCSSTSNVTKATADYTAKLKTAQDAYKTGSDAYQQSNDVASKLSSKFTFKESPTKVPGREDASSSASNAPVNIPPPSNLSDLPQYGSWSERSFGKVIQVSSAIAQGANQNFPIVFDLVFVKNAQIYSSLTTISTSDWFRLDRQEIQDLKKDPKMLEIEEVTVVPEKKNYLNLVRVPSGTLVGLFYVRLVGGQNLYPTVFNPYTSIDLKFSASDFLLDQPK
jgi:hypothetical protein